MNIKKMLRKIIVQGNNEIQSLYHEIFSHMREEFREDNLITAIDFIIELTFNSFKDEIRKYIKDTERFKQNVKHVINERIDILFSTLSV